MKRRMTFFNRDERAATGRTNFPAGGQGSCNRCAVGGGLSDFSGKKNSIVRRRRAKKLDRVIRGHRAGRMIFARLTHEMIRGGPIAVAIEQRADDSAIEDAGKRFITRLRFPLRDDLLPTRKTANAQTFRIRRAAAPAGIVRRVTFLERERIGAGHRAYLAPLGETPL
jgi:hypothetical protein